MLKERRMKKSARSWLMSADRDGGAPGLAVERRKRGCGGKECGIQYRNDTPERDALVRIEDRGNGEENRTWNKMKERQSWLRSADGN